MIKSIDTLYKGDYFRSRLEARWAAFFYLCGIKYEYEPEGFVNERGLCYLPDFYLPETYLRNGKKGVYIEIKHKDYDLDGFKHGDWFHKGLILFKGMPEDNIWGSNNGGGYQFYGDPEMGDDSMKIFQCADCGATKIEHHESNHDSCPECEYKSCIEFLKNAADYATRVRFEHRRV